MTDWREFTDRLAEQVATFPENAVVDIGCFRWPTSDRLVQIAQFGDCLWAIVLELPLVGASVSLGSGPELMSAVGWQPPGNPDHGTCWWIELPWPVSVLIHGQLAKMIVTGLRDFHCIPNASTLAYDAWDLDTSERAIDLPLLGIPARLLS
ncbi:hypothetical protein ACFXHA_12840 [Nocardia sp. NPDC059240]|uniref:TY-Chap domain-containing protein n=1 Tax=Nocardia sp. NPDC059240 TaxID=3346786 RepID=UPI00368E2C02